MTSLIPALVSILCLASISLAETPASSQPAPATSPSVVANHYIVKYAPNTTANDRQDHESTVHSIAVNSNSSEYRGIIETYDFGNFQGYYINVDPSTAEAIKNSNLTHIVEQDAIITADFVAAPSVSMAERLEKKQAAPSYGIDIVQGATWGQARISHRNQGQTDYVYREVSSTVYVIDTGIMTTHDEFQSPTGPRAIWGVNYIAGSPNTDENGHGTHVSGTIAGRTYGISSLTTLVACKVFDANAQGPWSNSISAIQWAVNDAAARNATARSVINMSLGGALYTAMNSAVEAAVQEGLAVVVAAGNSGVDAAGVSPASVPDAVTVAATDASDNRPAWSNFGPLVDIFAPGDAITSAWIGTNNATATLSGTSMACPHVSGICAYFIEQYGGMTPDALVKRLFNAATPGKVINPGSGSPNLLAYNANGA